MSRKIYVSKQPGGAGFRSVSEALAFLQDDGTEPVTIIIKEGVYREKLTIRRDNVTMIGEGHVVLTWDDYAGKLMENKETYGTFRSYTVFVDACDFTAKNITFENSAGPVGQALALYADGDRLVFDHCTFLGYQDTVFTGPLPPKEHLPGGFRGPKEFAPRIKGRQYFCHCRIYGNTDFIFGSAVAYFEKCEIISRKAGFITAASTPEGQEYGYVFDNCYLKNGTDENGEPCCKESSTYLGRPWREYAKTVFLNCRMDGHIIPTGWHDWDKPEAHGTICYAEYHSSGEGAPRNGIGRVGFSVQLTDEEAQHYTKDKVLMGADGWKPEESMAKEGQYR